MQTITLPERCDRAAAEVLLPEFVAAIGSGPLRIDGTATKQCGQAMLQLLVSARRTGEEQHAKGDGGAKAQRFKDRGTSRDHVAPPPRARRRAPEVYQEARQSAALWIAPIFF